LVWVWFVSGFGASKDMVRKAVDVVLLPDEAMTDKAIEANAELIEKFGRKIVLNKEDCLPHITLAMGCIDERAVGNVEKVLRGIAEESPLAGLRVVGVEITANSAGEQVSVFKVEKSKELQMLHENIMAKVGLYLSYDATIDMIAGSEAEGSTLAWINDYAVKSSFANFSPHITIGYGKMDKVVFPMQFAASKLALCHLWNNCMCKRLLVCIELNRQSQSKVEN